MKKKLLILFSLLLCAMFAAGCGNSSLPAPEAESVPTEAPAVSVSADVPEEPSLPGPGLLGGWTVTESPEVPDEVSALFDRAMEGFTGVGYESEALLATQIVAGRNYALFCRARAVVPDARPYYAVVTVYEDPDGNASIADVKALTPDGRSDENAGSATALAGGWSVPESQEEGLAAFDKAVGALLGVDYTPVLVTGEQVVAGMNYCVLCRAAAVTPAAEPCYCFVTVYRDLDGNCSVSNVSALGA